MLFELTEEEKLIQAAALRFAKAELEPVAAELDRTKNRSILLANLKKLAELARSLEEHYALPQDIEWAIDGELPFPGNVFLVQTRPVTVIGSEKSPTDKVLDGLLSMLKRSMTLS